MPSTRSVAKGAAEEVGREGTSSDGSGGIRSSAKNQQGTAGVSTTPGVVDRTYSDAARGTAPRLDSDGAEKTPAHATTETAMPRSPEIASAMEQMLEMQRAAETRFSETLQTLAHALGEFSARLPDPNAEKDVRDPDPESRTRSRDRRADGETGSNRTTSGHSAEKVRGPRSTDPEKGEKVRDPRGPGNSTGPRSGSTYRGERGGDDASEFGSEFTDQATTGYVPNAQDNPHAKALYTGGDTYDRPQTYDMHGDPTYDILRKKPNGSLCRAYRTVEPSLRYLYNISDYLAGVIDGLKIEGTVAPNTIEALDTVQASVDGVYALLNRYTATIHLRARYGENRDERADAKLQFIEGMLDEEDTLPAGLDDTVRQLGQDFDRQFQRERHLQLAKNAAKSLASRGPGGRGGGDGGGSRSAGGSRGPGKGGKGAEGNKSKKGRKSKADSDDE